MAEQAPSFSGREAAFGPLCPRQPGDAHRIGVSHICISLLLS
jgi:hypothetical protein